MPFWVQEMHFPLSPLTLLCAKNQIHICYSYSIGLYQKLNACISAFAPHAEVHGTAQGGFPGQTEHEHEFHEHGTAHGGFPSTVWPPCLANPWGFPSGVLSAQPPHKHQELQLLLCTWGSLLWAKLFLADALFECTYIPRNSSGNRSSHMGASSRHSQQGCCSSQRGTRPEMCPPSSFL